MTTLTQDTVHKTSSMSSRVQAVGRDIAELAGEFALALEMGSVLDDIAGTIHAHPTLSEAFHEAAHLGDLAGDFLQIGVERLGDVIDSGGDVSHLRYPKRPVM